MMERSPVCCSYSGLFHRLCRRRHHHHHRFLLLVPLVCYLWSIELMEILERNDPQQPDTWFSQYGQPLPYRSCSYHTINLYQNYTSHSYVGICWWGLHVITSGWAPTNRMVCPFIWNNIFSSLSPNEKILIPNHTPFQFDTRVFHPY